MTSTSREESSAVENDSQLQVALALSSMSQSSMSQSVASINPANPQGLSKKFRKLPIELQLMIWRLACMEPRNINLSSRCHPSIPNFGTNFLNPPPIPGLLHACTESRTEAQKFFTPMGLHSMPDHACVEGRKNKDEFERSPRKKIKSLIIENKSPYSRGFQGSQSAENTSFPGLELIGRNEKLYFINFDADHVNLTYIPVGCGCDASDRTGFPHHGYVTPYELPKIHSMSLHIGCQETMVGGLNWFGELIDTPLVEGSLMKVTFAPCQKIFESALLTRTNPSIESCFDMLDRVFVAIVQEWRTALEEDKEETEEDLEELDNRMDRHISKLTDLAMFFDDSNTIDV